MHGKSSWCSTQDNYLDDLLFFPFFFFFNVLTFQANLPFCNTNGDRMLERRNAVKYLKLGKNPQDSADGANVAHHVSGQ